MSTRRYLYHVHVPVVSDTVRYRTVRLYGTVLVLALVLALVLVLVLALVLVLVVVMFRSSLETRLVRHPLGRWALHSPGSILAKLSIGQAPVRSL